MFYVFNLILPCVLINGIGMQYASMTVNYLKCMINSPTYFRHVSITLFSEGSVAASQMTSKLKFLLVVLCKIECVQYVNQTYSEYNLYLQL